MRQMAREERILVIILVIVIVVLIVISIALLSLLFVVKATCITLILPITSSITTMSSGIFILIRWLLAKRQPYMWGDALLIGTHSIIPVISVACILWIIYFLLFEPFGLDITVFLIIVFAMVIGFLTHLREESVMILRRKLSDLENSAHNAFIEAESAFDADQLDMAIDRYRCASYSYDKLSHILSTRDKRRELFKIKAIYCKFMYFLSKIKSSVNITRPPSLSGGIDLKESIKSANTALNEARLRIDLLLRDRELRDDILAEIMDLNDTLKERKRIFEKIKNEVRLIL